MLNQRIDQLVTCIREARDEADNLGERILFFVGFLVIGCAFGFFLFLFCMLAFTLPKFFIPLYVSIFVLWQGYKRL